MPDLDPKRLPRHVAIIMDGNGRWAKSRLKSRIFGHNEGASSVREVVRCCHDLGIGYLTLYAFSMENWNRPGREVRGLWALLKGFLKSEVPELLEKQVRICHIGETEGIPREVLNELRKAMEKTSHCGEMILNLAINYGGRQEIVRAAQNMLSDIRSGRVDVDRITPEAFSGYLFTGNVPDPDLVIRTGGELRVSNFLLWQIAYAELYFTDILWPDFRREDFLKALAEFQKRERRYGRTGDQVKTIEVRDPEPGHQIMG